MNYENQINELQRETVLTIAKISESFELLEEVRSQLRKFQQGEIEARELRGSLFFYMEHDNEILEIVEKFSKMKDDLEAVIKPLKDF